MDKTYLTLKEGAIRLGSQLLVGGLQTAPLPEGKCPKCNGTDAASIETDAQGYLWARMCDCVKWRRIAKLIEELIPVEYREHRLETILARLDKHPLQQELIDYLRANPDASLFLCGDHGTGKSLFAYLLAIRAIERGRFVVTTTLAELMMHLWHHQRTSPQDILPLGLESFLYGAQRCTLIIDEFDQTRDWTDFMCEQIEMLLFAIYRHQHQLVVTVNITLEEVERMMTLRSEAKGLAMLRKIFQLRGMRRKELRHAA